MNTGHVRACANCRKPAGRLKARLWFPPLKRDASVPGPDWSVCCWNPIGCGCGYDLALAPREERA